MEGEGMDNVANLNAIGSPVAGCFEVDELLDRLRDLVANISTYVSRVGEAAAFGFIDEVVAKIAAISYERKELFAQVKKYCALHVAPVVAESNLARLISGEGLNHAKGGYLVMENIWGAARCDAEKYAGVTRRGELLNAYNCRSDNAQANVARIEWFASLLSDYAQANIAALGSGSAIEIREHLARRDNGNTFHVFDQCPDACHKAREIVQARHVSKVMAVHGNPIIGLIKSKMTFDFIYSLGMLDYFNDEDSVMLAGKLLARVNPGGMLILGNARPESRTRLWLELMGGWNLNYKSNTKMQELGKRVADNWKYEVLTDTFGVYNFLKINKE